MSPRIAQNFAGFEWNLVMLARKNLAFIDAQPKADVVQAGSFDLSGMLTALGLTVAAK